MRITNLVAAATLPCLLVLAALCADQPDAVTPQKKIVLFNGRDLAGWYSWSRDSKYEDPKKVFTVVNGVIRISGEEWGGIATRQMYRDYHLVVEWKWGGPTHGQRKTKARDSGILVHGVGEDGAHAGTWLESIESQVIEGGCGDFIMVGGLNKPSLTAEVIEGPKNQLIWHRGGKPVTRDSGRFNWYGRDPDWKDEIDFRGKQDIEKPVGEWNRQEVICDRDTIKNIVNGKEVNYATQSSHTFGKIQLQSEGAEILFRRLELLPIKR
jgi:hypothetical protein